MVIQKGNERMELYTVMVDVWVIEEAGVCSSNVAYGVVGLKSTRWWGKSPQAVVCTCA